MKKLILIALNEFNAAFFRHACKVADLPNISQLLSMQHSRTWTDDKVERKGLDPWVQWVSIHTGTPSSQHGIRHLGDVPNLSSPQLWERLSEHGVSSGIWGAMNATRGSAEQCHFFLPDPWTFSEPAFPSELNNLLALPRYYSRNYLEVGKLELTKSLGKLLLFLLTKPTLIMRLLRVIPLAVKGVAKFGLNNQVLFSVFDLVSATAFFYYKKSRHPQFSLVFLNSIAHVQHNIWCAEGTLDEHCLYALEAIDRSLGILTEGLENDESVVVMNALNQRNIVGKKHEILYRQINPARFLDEVGIRYNSVEQLMTNDAHILFETNDSAINARNVLAGASIDGQPIFDVEYSDSTPRKLFFQLEYWQDLPDNAQFLLAGKNYPFFEHFEAVVKRTGEHLQDGDAYCRGLELPDKLYNHEVQHHILQYFDIEASTSTQFRSGSSEPTEASAAL